MHNIGCLYYTQIISVSKITANKAKEEQKQYNSNPCTWFESAVETREANMSCFSTLSEEDNTLVFAIHAIWVLTQILLDLWNIKSSLPFLSSGVQKPPVNHFWPIVRHQQNRMNVQVGIQFDTRTSLFEEQAPFPSLGNKASQELQGSIILYKDIRGEGSVSSYYSVPDL